LLFIDSQIESIAPEPAAFKAGKKLSDPAKWLEVGKSERGIWGQIKGSGKSLYFTQIDIQDTAYKCSCPSRQFPCKHGIALMLVFAQKESETDRAEPEWVEDWLKKRREKSSAPKQEEERTDEDIAKSDAGKTKRQEDRLILVNSGVVELTLWLQDIARVGLLELQNKPKSYFSDMAARMVDAKASGLAGWVKTLGKVDFSNPEEWYVEACIIIGKINLLLKAWKNHESLPPLYLQTIKNLIGWNQSKKELLTDKKATAVKDHWVVLGIENEPADDITINRTWLHGIESNRFCLVLNFGSPFAPLVNTMMLNSILEAEVAFFPSIHEQRGIVRMQKEVKWTLPDKPVFHDNWESLLHNHLDNEKLNPWINNQPYLLANAALIKEGNQWYLIDHGKDVIAVDSTFTERKAMNWILLSGGGEVDIALVRRGKKMLPLGIFLNDKYMAL
jgi:hypothetical protein